jgi:predicted outer membrane repeat protein
VLFKACLSHNKHASSYNSAQAQGSAISSSKIAFLDSRQQTPCVPSVDALLVPSCSVS